MSEATKPQDKPGGSNAGKYKTGPFCGPSGGAPKGTYPVNTRKRAISALAYARNAPNPSGIKKCVCRNWKDLPACKSGKESQDQEWDINSIAALDELKAMYHADMLDVEGVLCMAVDIHRIENLSDSELAEIAKYLMVDEEVDKAVDKMKEFINAKK